MNLHTDARAEARRGLLLIVLAAVLWGTVGVATKTIFGLSDTNPLSIGFFRVVFSVPVLLAAEPLHLNQSTPVLQTFLIMLPPIGATLGFNLRRKA